MTFPAGSGEEILRRIRIWGPGTSKMAGNGENQRQTLKLFIFVSENSGKNAENQFFLLVLRFSYDFLFKSPRKIPGAQVPRLGAT